jgi:methylthioribose-1-phosphate isomerase
MISNRNRIQRTVAEADIEIGPRLTAVANEARDWITDCFADAPASLTYGELITAINRHYDGGWDAFVLDTRPMWVAIPLGAAS